MMKKITVAFLLITSIAFSQNYQTVEELDDACSQLGFIGDEEAEIAVDNILDQIGLFRNFTIQECPEINNAVAKNIEISPGHKERYILYDSQFFKRIDTKASNDWAAVSILAHEIAHHLNGHALNNEGSNHKFELEADYFSGSALAKMGASLEEAQSAINTLKYEKATATHPAKANRLAMIAKGWNKAKGITTNITVEEKEEEIKEDKSFEFYRKGELAYAAQNYEEAIAHFIKAKDLGFKDSYYYLSHMYYTGLGDTIDDKKAFQLAKTGYELGSIPATYQLGKYFSNGTGTKKNEEEAQRLFQKDFQIKWFKDQYNKYKTPFHAYAIGYMYRMGYGGVKKDQQNAVIWYKQAINDNDVMGASNLGVMYDNGEYVEEDNFEAYRLYKIAANGKSPAGMYNLGVAYQNGNGTLINYKSAIEQYTKAANLGSAIAMNNLGALYLNGKGVSKDKSIALKWLKKGADLGNSDAMKNLGLIYREENNANEAIKWLEMASENGKTAYAIIGEMYYAGTDVQEDNDKALAYFEKGADAGEELAFVYLAYFYDEGKSVPFNWKKAAYYYEKGADLGNRTAKRMLGEFYLFGVGGKNKDVDKAKSLFKEAANNGDKTAESYLQIMKDINNSTYHVVQKPNHSGRIFITDEMLAADKDSYPFVFEIPTNNWNIDISYELNETSAVQIFPIKVESEIDFFNFSNFSPCGLLSDSTGSHGAFVSINDVEEGYRAIKYIYYRATFLGEEDQMIIKAPVMVCWLPKSEY